MKRSRRKHAPEFEAKVALDALREGETVQQLGARTRSTRCRCPAGGGRCWRTPRSGSPTAGDRMSRGASREDLLRTIGELTVERDFLANGLRGLQ